MISSRATEGHERKLMRLHLAVCVGWTRVVWYHCVLLIRFVALICCTALCRCCTVCKQTLKRIISIASGIDWQVKDMARGCSNQDSEMCPAKVQIELYNHPRSRLNAAQLRRVLELQASAPYCISIRSLAFTEALLSS